MSKDSAEKYLDNLLNTVSSEQGDILEEYGDGSSHALKRSEDDFLKKFEDELEADKYNNYIADFEMELEAEQNKDKNIGESAKALDDDTNELSLDEVLENAQNQTGMSEEKSRKQEKIVEPIDDMTDFEEDLDTAVEKFDSQPVEEEADGESDMEEDLSVVSEPDLSMTEIGEPNLAGTDDVPLEDMLDGDLSEIGDLLSGKVEDESQDEIGEFAQKEISAQQLEETPESGKAEKGKKKGFFARIIEALFGSDDEEDEIVKEPIDDGMANLTEENAQILRELEGAEEQGGKKKKKKEKKEKKPKEKKEKPKKEKKEKKPKEKKEKKPKVKDNTPPLPKVPVFMIWFMVGSMFILVLLGSNLMGYQTKIDEAKSFYLDGNYAEAVKNLEGLSIKKNDEQLYNRVKLLASVESEYSSYQAFIKNDKQLMAFDSLICAAGRCNTFAEDAKTYDCEDDLAKIRTNVENELKDKYGMTLDEALQLYDQKDRDEYTIVIYKKLAQLGIEVE